MTRLIDPQIEKLQNMLRDMASLSEKSVETAIAAFTRDKPVTREIFQWSEQLNLLHEQASDLAMEIIARYQPVASDLRYIKSCIEISYGFSRLGRYALDVSQIVDALGSMSGCDTSEITEVGDMVKKMIHQSIDAYFNKDTSAAEALRGMDDQVDARYMGYIKRIASMKRGDLRCAVALTLAMRYMERMGDHACYIGDSVVYVATGSKGYIR